MYINPYGADPVTLAADLANRRPRTTRELVDRCREAGVTIDRSASDADLDEVDTFLDAWLVVVDTTTPHGRADALNALLAEHSAPPRLTDHDGHWHVHYRADDVSFARLLTAMFAVGTALHLTSRGIDRLARCAADDCVAVFADTTRNGRKTYCSTRCTNRCAVRRHRARE
ncbi:CGNR zinc finger domain-containing protein [Dietzia maris]|uniref:CGNR zinc finger domain-containing protein n=1 Tax=Dietzia maris TaxID=37915 RepID=UPI00223C3FE9|nr:CGNR zinc finger domain-containing protein [Dietzia maris]MCT1435280.1 CGNR zinc finger domain-containing protein [Dietzia maris]MCT1522469.1 CGNR zinc finger domain-containing protein [Dietzia maris]